MFEIMMGSQEEWVTEMKNELLSLVALYEDYCQLYSTHHNEHDLPNWRIMQQAIMHTDSPEALLEISEKLMHTNSLILEMSNPIYCV